LSMTPTGWLQVAWSTEIAVGTVHTMNYFGREMVAWRSRSGRISVFDAYCEHIGAHLGHGGHVEGENLVCP
ncbi:Rieske 2Fe-2S domain-containing protein, partial [Gordonia alkanivorans]|uniref:Rieske 2Fe-2S domain-containing protein n=1 Tax=Gordonia alkanivorans TaxID=84096 RepID=UPI0024B84673